MWLSIIIIISSAIDSSFDASVDDVVSVAEFLFMVLVFFQHSLIQMFLRLMMPLLPCSMLPLLLIVADEYV